MTWTSSSGIARPFTFLAQVVMAAVIVAPITWALRWSVAELGWLQSYDGPLAWSSSLVALGPLFVGSVIERATRAPFRHLWAFTLPGLRRRMMWWHISFLVLAAAAFVKIEYRSPALRSPVAANFVMTLFLLGIVPAGLVPKSRRLGRIFAVVLLLLVLLTGIFGLEIAGLIKSFPAISFLVGLAGAIAAFWCAFERENLRRLCVAADLGRGEQSTGQGAVPPTFPLRISFRRIIWMSALVAGIAGVVIGCYYRHHLHSSASSGDSAHQLRIMTTPLLMWLPAFLTAFTGRLLVRNDTSPVPRAKRLANSLRIYRGWYLTALCLIFTATLGASVGLSIATPRVIWPQLALALEIEMVAFPLGAALQLACARWLRNGWIRLSQPVGVIAACVPAIILLANYRQGSAALLITPLISAALLGLAVLLHLACVAILRGYYLHDDLVRAPA